MASDRTEHSEADRQCDNSAVEADRERSLLTRAGGMVAVGFILAITAPPFLQFAHPGKVLLFGLFACVAVLALWEWQVAKVKGLAGQPLFWIAMLGVVVVGSFLVIETATAISHVEPTCQRLQRSLETSPSDDQIALFEALKCWSHPA